MFGYLILGICVGLSAAVAILLMGHPLTLAVLTYSLAGMLAVLGVAWIAPGQPAIR